MDFASWPAAERRGILAGAAILVCGATLAMMKLGDSATLIALIFFPLLGYGIVSGKIQEFSGPGGWGAKFQQIAAEKIKPAGLTDCIQDFKIVEKGGMEALRDAGQTLERGRPVALTLKLGQKNYNAPALKAYVNTLRAADPDTLVLFLDTHGRLAVSAEADSLLSLLANNHQAGRLIDAVRESNAEYLRALPGFHWQTISRERSNAEALQAMREANARTMVAVDSEKRPVGVVKRDDIISRLLVEMAGSYRQGT